MNIPPAKRAIPILADPFIKTAAPYSDKGEAR